MNIYYVYAYLRDKDSKTAASGTPYYIGKGKNDRAWNRHKNIPVPKDHARIVILESGLTELGAFAIERRMIRWYGKKDDGSGILLNITEGGTGGPMVESIRQKIGAKNKGKPAPNKGQKMSEEQRLKMVEIHNNRSEETCRKISKALTGKKETAESNAKRSAALLGTKQSAEWIEKRIAGKRGKPNIGASLAMKGIPKPKLVCRLEDRKEMTISNYIQWAKTKGA